MTQPRRFAIVIGINDYQGGIPKLDTAVNDARAIATVLNQRYGYKVACLLDKSATASTIRWYLVDV